MMQGVMLDCSRNGVMTVQAVKRFAKIISDMGYNTLMLYTEDTYEVDNEPFFGYLRGRYTKAELKELDAYCLSVGIELVPCIQALAHLNCMFKWKEYAQIRDCDDILLIGAERTYELLDHIFSTISQCFTSRRIHIGMDEAGKVGLGRYLAEHGYQDRFELLSGHLHKVCDMAAGYGFETMVWSDMFCRLALNSGNYWSTDGVDLESIRQKANLPENVAMVYWDYFSKDYDRYIKMLDVNKAFGKKVYFAGGAWSWKGFAPDNTFSIDTTAVAMQACRDSGVDGWIMTAWGDDGNECAMFALLPSLLFAIEAAKGNTDMVSIKEKFRAITGAGFDTFLLLDELDQGGANYGGNPSKYLFYNDAFLGINDYRTSEKDNRYYAVLAEKIHNADGKGSYGYLFDYYEKLCDVLAVKCDLGVRTRKYYAAGDKAALMQLARETYPLAIERVKAFHRVFQKAWMTEKKPHGFDVQDIRIGGVLQRLTSCAERLRQYAQGETETIPELEETLLEANCGHLWGRSVTVNVVEHEP